MEIWKYEPYVGAHALCRVDRNNNVLNGADKSWDESLSAAGQDNNFLEEAITSGEETASALVFLISLLEG